MFELGRTNTSFIGRWWWTVDRYLVLAIIFLLGMGAVLIMASSPSVASRIGLEPYFFINRQLIYIAMGSCVIFVISLLNPVNLRRLCILGFIACIFLMLAVLLFGTEIKGSKRWISILGFSLQPSEFMKTFFIVFVGWVLSKRAENNSFKPFLVAGGLYAIFAFLLILQPDFGTTVVITLIWMAQMFLAGLPWILVIIAAFLCVAGAFSAYMFLPHVTTRINKFLNPESSDTYQVDRSIQAFLNGGFLGRGPGQGVVKERLPDSHTDFIFAVAGEELGMVTCLAIIGVFAFILLRVIIKILKEEDIFLMLAVAGLVMAFSLQSLINISVSLHLIPTKGMTLPFISYGGSSMLSVSLLMGIILAFTRKRFGHKSSGSKNNRGVKKWKN